MRSGITIGWIIAFLTTLMIGTFFYYRFQKKKSELRAHGVIELNYMVKNINAKFSEFREVIKKMDRYDSLKPNQPFYKEMHINQAKLLNDTTRSQTPADYFITLDKRLINFEQFLEGIIRNDFFEELMVVNMDRQKTIYASKNHLHWSKDFDHVLQLHGDSSLGTQQTEVDISGTTYLAFYSNFILGNQRHRIVGFKNKATFQNEARQISPFLLNNAFLLLLLILCGIPIIRVFGMGKGDYLAKIHVIEVGFGILALSFVFSFGLGFYTNSQRVENYHETQLELNRDTLVTQSNSLLEKHLRSLISLNGLRNNGKRKSFLVKNKPKYNEYIESGKDTLKVTTLITPQYELSKGDCILTNLSKRDYFLVFLKTGIPKEEKELKDQMNYLPHANETPIHNTSILDSFFISSHYSYANGKFEGVVSRKPKQFISALTFNFEGIHALNQPDLNQQDFRSMIIRNDGKIIYHSETEKRWSNLFDEIENTQTEEKIKAYIKSQDPELKTKFRFENVECHALFSPLKFKSKGAHSFYLVVYQDQNLPYIQSSLALSNTLIFIIGSIILLSVLALFMFAGRYTSERTSFSIFSYQWLRPSPKHVTGHLQNILLCGFHLVSIILVTRFDLNNIAVYFLIFAQSLTVISLFRYLNINLGPSFKFTIPPKEVNWIFIVGTATLLVTFTVILLLYYHTQIFIFFHLTIQFLGILLVFIAKPLFKKWGGASFSKSSQIFILSTLIWLVTIAFVPTLIIQNKMTQIEQHLWKNRNDKWKKDKHSGPITYDALLTQLRITPQQIDILGEPVSSYYFSGQATIRSLRPSESQFKSASFWYLLTIPLFIIALFLLVKNISNRLFLTHLMVGLKARATLKPFLTEKTFCIGLPHSGRSVFINNLLPTKAKLKEFDFIDFNEVIKFQEALASNNFNLSCDAIQIRNMDSLIYDFESFNVFLDAIGNYNKNSRTKLIIYSHSTMDEIMERISDTAEVKQAKDKLINKLTYLFTSFVTLIVPLKPEPLSWRTSPIMAKEFRYGPNIKKLHRYGLKTTQKLPLTQDQEENIILAVKEYNYTYYLTLWNTLTIWEKHTIYDIAKNGFLNYANLEKIDLLCKKGVLQINNKDQQIELFNHSFGLFVQGILNPDEIKVFKKIHQKEGNWNAIRLIILFIIVAIILFLYLTDPNMINKSLGVISIVSTSFFALYRLYQGVTSFRFQKTPPNEILDI